MAGKDKYDWEKIIPDVVDLIGVGELKPTWVIIGKHLGIPPTTVSAAVGRAEITIADLGQKAAFSAIPGGAIKHQKATNSWDINCIHPEIHTVAQLLKYCEVDLDVWRVAGDASNGPILNAWPTTAKKKKVDLKYTPRIDNEGKARTEIEGSVFSDGELISKTNIQVKVRLVRINPVPIMVTIQPLEISGEIIFPAPKPRKTKVKKTLFIADPHFGFSRNIHSNKLTSINDRRVMDIALQILSNERFDDVTILGDILDLSEWSTRWVTAPEFYWTTQPTLIESFWWLRAIREAQPDAEIDVLEGNHNRIKSALIARLLAAYELRAADELGLPPALSLPKLLALHKLNIGFIDGYDSGSADKWLSDAILATHGDNALATPGATARKVAEKTMHTTIFGHIHRRELVTNKIEVRDGHITQTAMCPGTACKIDGSVPGNKLRQQWQQGIATMEWCDDVSIPPRFDLIEINEGVGIYDGVVLRSRDVDAKLDAHLAKNMEGISQ